MRLPRHWPNSNGLSGAASIRAVSSASSAAVTASGTSSRPGTAGALTANNSPCLAIFAYIGSMQQTIAILAFETEGEGLHEITEQVTTWVRETPIRVGILTLFSQHTSA